MNQDNFKKLLEESLKPLQIGLDEVRQGLGEVKKDLEQVKKVQDEHTEIIEKRILPPLVYIETTVKSYADRYVTNEDHIRRLDKRLDTVEDELGIQPPQELTIPPLD